jgi:hypothetical protein
LDIPVTLTPWWNSTLAEIKSRGDTEPVVVGRALRSCAVAVMCVGALGLASCTGSSPHYAQPTLPSRHTPQQAPSSSASHKPKFSSFAKKCFARNKSGGMPVVFFGGETNREFCGIVWANDRVSSCGTDAYGAKVIAFVKKHKCGPVRRVLATVYSSTFSVDFSSVIVKFAKPGTPNNPSGTLFNFTQLAKPRSAAGIADLLRAGQMIPGPHGHPPASAYYGNDMLTSSVDLFYDWYVKRPKSTHFENSLRLLGADFAFTQLTG